MDDIDQDLNQQLLQQYTKKKGSNVCKTSCTSALVCCEFTVTLTLLASGVLNYKHIPLFREENRLVMVNSPRYIGSEIMDKKRK